MKTRLPDLDQADRRFKLQTRWSEQLRAYIYRKLPTKPLNILEVGCGTGAVLACLEREIPDRIRMAAGIDIDPEMAAYAARKQCGILCVGSGELLPFPSDCFDFVLCHYLLLWTEMPDVILREMRRVTVSGGICAALAEPCYTEMEAEPRELKALADLQRDKLAERGANLSCGKELPDYFSKAGFARVEWNRYGELPQSRAFLEAEAGQMVMDTGAKSLPVLPENSRYSVPTYYAVAEKGAFVRRNE